MHFYFVTMKELNSYEKYYSEVINAVQMIVEGYSSSDCCKLLQLYFDSKIMTRKDIFNKYKLNEKIYTYAHEHITYYGKLFQNRWNAINLSGIVKLLEL